MTDLWGKIKSAVVEGAHFAKEKTEELSKIGKKKLDILQTKRNITKQFTELGGLIFEKCSKKDVKTVNITEEMREIVDKIKKFEAELEEREKELEELSKKEGTE